MFHPPAVIHGSEGRAHVSGRTSPPVRCLTALPVAERALLVVSLRFVAGAVVCPDAELQVPTSGFILPTRKGFKCSAEMALETAAVPKGVNSARVASSYFFKRGTAHVIGIFFSSFFFLYRGIIDIRHCISFRRTT